MTNDAELAKQVCTDAELDVLYLHAAGFGRPRGSAALGISENAWRWRLASAFRKIHNVKKEAKAA